MFKILMLSVALVQGICEVTGDNNVGNSDTDVAALDQLSKTNDREESLSNQSQGTYNFHAANQIFNLNGPFAWKTPGGLISNMKELGADYHFSNGIGAHKLHRRKLTWSKARQICVEEGGHLAVIRTDAEEKVILQMMVEDSIDDAWLGAHDKFQEGDWITVTDESLAETGWARWSKKFPTNPDNWQGKQNCARLVRNGGGMDDDNCDIAKPFVCKI